MVHAVHFNYPPSEDVLYNACIWIRCRFGRKCNYPCYVAPNSMQLIYLDIFAPAVTLLFFTPKCRQSIFMPYI